MMEEIRRNIIAIETASSRESMLSICTETRKNVGQLELNAFITHNNQDCTI